jgi:hypothetical protein
MLPSNERKEMRHPVATAQLTAVSPRHYKKFSRPMPIDPVSQERFDCTRVVIANQKQSKKSQMSMRHISIALRFPSSWPKMHLTFCPGEIGACHVNNACPEVAIFRAGGGGVGGSNQPL